MEQHPVPQHISSYEFRLIGEMTLKQFGYLAAGAILALIFYGLPIPAFFKWPLIFVCAFAGFAFAFLPAGERPLITWVTAFFKSVFSPTLFVWQKKEAKPDVLAPTIRPPEPAKTPATSADRAGLTKYLESLPIISKPTVQVDQQEQNFLQNITHLLQTERSLAPHGAGPAPQPPAAPQPQPTQPQPTQPQPTPPAKPVSPQVPKPQKSQILARPFTRFPFAPPVKKRLHPEAVAAKTGSNLPFPEPPSQPNILSGMVLNTNGQIVEGAILEIRNNQGVPVRAFKTNKLGQFTIATPLPNGSYEIETEKEGFKFDIIKFEAKGEIIKPIEIRAKP